MEGHAFVSTAFSIVTALLGLGGLIRGWQMASGRRLDLISDWNNRQLPDPVRYCRQFARTYLSMGVLLLVVPLLLVAGIHILIVGSLAAFLVWYWLELVDRIVVRAKAD